MRAKNVMNKTADNRTYKAAQKRYLDGRKDGLRCSICPPNRGCNANKGSSYYRSLAHNKRKNRRKS